MDRNINCFIVLVVDRNDVIVNISEFNSSSDSSDQTTDGSANNRDHQPQPQDVPPTGQGRDEANQVFKGEEEEEEKSRTSTPDKAPSTLVPLQLSQLRTKNTDSFDIEEVHDILIFYG